jgi:hypothetical protein
MQLINVADRYGLILLSNQVKYIGLGSDSLQGLLSIKEKN